MSVALASAVAAGILVWWSGFDAPPPVVEVAIGGILVILFVVVATVVFSAALLSFSIHEARRIPLVAQKDRTAPLAIIALLTAAVIGGWVFRASNPHIAEVPAQVVVSPSTARVALLAVDGMTWDLFAAQRPAGLKLEFATPLTPFGQTHSSAERWASLGTGTGPRAHQVRAIDGIRLVGGSEILQTISHWDLAIDQVAVRAGLARRIPLPPTVRRRAYIWEVLGARGVRSAAVNWWVTEDDDSPNLLSVSQASIFSEAATTGESPVDLALSIDRTALARLDAAVSASEPRFVTAYLPASDIVLNRLELEQSARVAASIRAAGEVFKAARRLHDAGYDVVIVGMPGDGAEANAVLASTLPAGAPPTLDSIAPTLLTLMGFPASEEMSAAIFLSLPRTSRIPTYGDRNVTAERTTPSDEYYDSLKSLGYIR
jgi:hypothetical protein